MPNMDSMANGGAEPSAEAPEAEERRAIQKSSPAVAVAATKGRGLRRWRRIRREQQRESVAAGGSSGGGGGRADEDSAQLHKRRIPLPPGAPKVKHVDPGLGFPIAFAVGADSDHSEDQSRRSSSTAASAPRVLARHGHDASLRGKHPRAARSRADMSRVHGAEAENSRSCLESDLRSSKAVKAPQLCVSITGNGVHRGLSASGDHGDGQPSEEVRSTAAGGYYKENGSSVVGKLAQISADSDDDGVKDTLDEGSVRNGQNGGLHSSADPYSESVLLLQRALEALENEIVKTMAIAKVPSNEFDVYNDEWSGSVNLVEPSEEVSESIKHLEFRLEEASALIKEKDSRILELEALSRMQPRKTSIGNTSLLSPQSELEGLYQRNIEAEIQCIVMTRAYQTLATLVDDQMALYEAQRSLSEDYKELGLKLRHAENRAMVLEEKAEKLQMQCKELSRSSEVLQLQSKASRVSLFCFVQFILLCVAIGTYLMGLVSSTSNEVVPT